MEAIKFSELPTGDRMPLADEDGVPIIANQENRLLTWGRLKKQLADQTHTDEVKPDESKVPTSAAVENRVATTEKELDKQIETLSASATNAQTKADTATRTADEAKTMASSAKISAEDATAAANEAKTAAEKANASSTINEALGIMRLYLNNTPEASSDVASDRLLAQIITDTDEQARDISLLAEMINGNFYRITQVVNEMSADLASAGSGGSDYAGYRVEITAGSIDDANGLMDGATSITETTEETSEPLPVAETLALIFRNQEAMYQILIDTRKRAIANATNLTAMLTNINAVLSQVMN